MDLATGHRANTLAVDVRAMRRRRGILEPWSLSPPAHPAKPQQAIVPPSSAVADPAKSDNDDDDACFSEDACNQAIEAATPLLLPIRSAEPASGFAANDSTRPTVNA